jgi:hypothetical protein
MRNASSRKASDCQKQGRAGFISSMVHGEERKVRPVKVINVRRPDNLKGRPLMVLVQILAQVGTATYLDAVY